MSTGNRWHCGASLQQASQYVGLVDAFLGTISTLVIINVANQPEYDYRRIFGIYIDYTLAIFLVNAFVTQVMMGIVLYVAAERRSRNMVRFWLFTAALTALFTGLPIRIYEMLIVNEFSWELKEKKKAVGTARDVESSSASHHDTELEGDSGFSQKALTHSGMKTAKKFGADGSGLLNGYFQTEDQQLVVAPQLTNLYEIPGGRMDQCQYTRRILLYNPISQLPVPNPWLPAFLAAAAPQPHELAENRRMEPGSGAGLSNK